MTARRHKVGDRIEVDGLTFRIVQGRKFDGDQVLELYGPSGWIRPTFALAYVVADVLGQNEDARYSPDLGYLGGEKLVRAVRTAYRDGWRGACSELQQERARAADRRRQLSLDRWWS